MLRRVVRCVPTLGRWSIQRGFCTSNSSSNTENQAQQGQSENASATASRPKWMKFFSGQEPMQIDLDRSMKSENVELIQTYIKTNYTRFKDEQLVRVLPKISRSLLIDKVKAEIRSRILAGTFQLTIEEGCKLVEYLEEINYNDRLIVFHVLTIISEQVQHLDHLQSFQLVHLSLRINKISYPIARNFLDFVAGFDQAQIVEIFASFDHQQASNYMFTLATLQHLLKEELLNPTIMEVIVKTYLNKLNEFINLSEIAASTHFDRIFKPAVLRLFNAEQKLEFKKLLIKAIELRFDTETNLGKFGYIKGDKGITIVKSLGLLREVVHSNERSLVEKSLVLMSNSVLNRDSNEFKFDFRMFSYFAKYNYAYKFYIDESFVSIKSLLRSLLSNTKKSLSEEQDINGYHLLFLKSKSYSELNYGSIISNSEEVYTRKVDFSDSMHNQWNQFQADLQNCLQDYLQMQISSSIFEKVFSRIPDRSEINLIDEQENDHVQIESLDSEETGSSSGFTNSEKKNEDLKALKHGETYASEWMQHDRDAVEGSLDKGQSAQFKDDDDYMKKVGYKLIEYQRRLSAAKYVKYVSYQQRTTFAQTVYLRYFICTVETIQNSLSACEPSEEFLAVLRMWAKQEKLIEVLECFGMVPGVLESLLFIEAYGKIKKNQTWFSPAVTEWMLKNKFIVESILTEEVSHIQRNPSSYLNIIEKQIASLLGVPRSGELPLDPSYDAHQTVISIMNSSYFVSQDRYDAQLVKVAEMSEGNVRLQRKRDLVSEQFITSKENLLRKVMHSQAFSSFVNESQLKKFTGDVLFNLSPTTQKNLVFYPFFADFLLPSKKIVVQVRERNRLVDGVDNSISGFHQMNEQFLKMIGYRIVYIELADFEIDYKTFQLNILQKILKPSP